MASKGKNAPAGVTRTALPLWRRPIGLGLALALAAVVVYFPVFGNELVNYDDDYYISQNAYLKLGLGLEGVKWAFTESYGANWYPLTWLSLMLDYELFGMSPAGFHATNLALHAAAVVVLFIAFVQMTGSMGASAFVAAVFALHPTHVESVAWAAERKDVLSGLFWMLALWAYSRYSRKPETRRYLLVALFLALGLLSKPMVVTLPFVLLLLDFWPLERVERLGWRRLVVEKIPLFALVVATSVVTFFAQRAEGAVQSLQTYSLGVRIENALVAYVAYIGKAFWPTRLSPYYPHPGETISLWKAGAAFALLAALSLVAIAAARRRRELRFLPVGWLWYLGTLVPVIGIVQVGQQAMADRYTYLPYVGLSVVVAFGVIELAKRSRIPRSALVAAGVTSALAMSVLTFAQARVWRNSVTLFEHALSVTENNPLAHINLGVAYLNDGRLDEAARELEAALRLHPGSAEAHSALATVRSRQERPEEAHELYRAALRLDPSSSQTHRELGNFLLESGDAAQALVHFREASSLAPADGDAVVDQAVALGRQGRHEEALALFALASTRANDPARLQHNWGVVLMESGDLDAAISRFREAVALRPDYAEARFSWGQAALARGSFPEAVEQLREVVRIEPENEDAHYHLGLALANADELDEAFAHFDRARSLKPDRAEVHYSLGLVFARVGDLDRAAESFTRSLEISSDQADAWFSLGHVDVGRGRFEEAIASYRRALELVPDYAPAHNSWGIALASTGRIDEAIEHFESALRIDPGLAEAQNNWGLALSRKGSVSEAVEHFRAAVALEPGNADAYNNLGVSLGQLGRMEEAVRAFEKAVELFPGHESARQNLENAREALRE